MKNLKIFLTVILVVMIVTISTVVFAYTGIGDVDPEDKITMPSDLTNGEGSVLGISAGMSYQFVEITATQYAKIKKLEAQIKLIQVYSEYAENPADEGLTSKYKAVCDKYNTTYKNDVELSTVTDVLNRYKSDNPLGECTSEWIFSLADYKEENWQSSTNSKITLDLTTFEGTKYFVGWIRTTINSTTVYDAEAYVAKGTKKTNPNEPSNPNEPTNPNEPSNPNEPTNPNEPSNPNEPNNSNQIENPNNSNKKDNTKTSYATTTSTPTSTKKDNTVTDTVLPKTGVSNAILGLIAVLGISAGISYRKYRKIK